jgi:hypothetical protein
VTAATDFKSYHVLLWRKAQLVGTKIPISSALEIWGSPVHVARWAAYDGDVLRSVYRERWANELEAVLKLGAVEVIGEDARGVRYALKTRGEGVSAATHEPRPGAPSGRRKGSGLGVYVRHLRDIEELEYPDILQVVLAGGNARFIAQVKAWGEYDLDRLSGLRNVYADAAEAHEKACRYGCAG